MTTETTAAADGTVISYTDRGGSGSDVVLVHGITENSSSWGVVADKLADGHRLVTLDLRGHGQSGNADRYDLEAMAGDVIAVAEAASLNRPHIVGHSLGGAVVSAVAAAYDVASVVNVDQSLQLGGFKEQLTPFEAMLRDPETFPVVIEGVFADLVGSKLAPEEIARLNEMRRPDQEVVLGVWEMIFALSEDEVNAVVEGALGGFAAKDVPYLSLFGIDPGPDYGQWLTRFVKDATVEVWPEHGHYPHLVDPDRFIERLQAFWA